jgi:hypothetical protein
LIGWFASLAAGMLQHNSRMQYVYETLTYADMLTYAHVAGMLQLNSLMQYVYETSPTHIQLSDFTRASLSAQLRIRQRLSGHA